MGSRTRGLLRGPATLVAGLLAAVLLAGVAVLGTAAPAAAHASLIGTDPAEGEVLAEAPAEVTFTFDEAVTLPAEGVRLFDAAGEELDVEASGGGTEVVADLPDELAEGTYVVVWRTVSADGHPISGSLSFSVGSPSAEVAAPGVETGTDPTVRAVTGVVQGVALLGLLVAAGLTLLGTWVLDGVRDAATARGRLRRPQRLAAVLAVVGTALLVPLAGAEQQGGGLDAVLEPATYDLTLIDQHLLSLGLVVLGLAGAVLLSGGWPRVAAAALAVAGPAVVGHTRGFEPVPLLVAADVVHLAAGAVWLGGLVGLVLVLPGLAGRPRDAAGALSRFSTAGASVVALLVATGSLLGWRILGSWSGLIDTAYGRLLLVKVGIALLVVALAAWNRFRLLPRVEADLGHEASARATGRVRRTVLLEAGGLVAVLAVTGFLVDQPPRAQESAAEQTAPSRVVSSSVEDLRVLATLSPERTGSTVLAVQVQDAQGEPVDLLDAPEVTMASPEVDLGPVPLTPTGAGTYEAEVVLPSPGTWEVRVSLRSGEFDNPVTSVEFDVT